MAEVEIGIGKSGRRAYGFDDIAIVPEPAHPRPRGRRHLLGDRRLPLRAAPDGRGHGRRDQPGHRDRDRPARRRRRAQPRGPVDPLRGSRAALRRDRRARRREGHRCGCRRSTASRSSPSWSAQRIREIQRRRRRVVRVGHAAAHRRSFAEGASSTPSSTCSSSRARSCRPSTCRRRVEPLNLKRFVRELDIPVIVGGCASYQAALHLMRTGAAGVLVGVGPGHACTTRRRARHRRAPGHRHRRRPGRPHAPPRRDRRVRPRHRRRRHGHRRRHRQGHRLRRRRRHDRLAAGRRRTRRPAAGYHWGMATFHPTLPRGRPGATTDRAARSRRSSSARPTRTTAASTCSARCAPRWPPAATRR